MSDIKLVYESSQLLKGIEPAPFRDFLIDFKNWGHRATIEEHPEYEYYDILTVSKKNLDWMCARKGIDIIDHVIVPVIVSIYSSISLETSVFGGRRSGLENFVYYFKANQSLLGQHVPDFLEGSTRPIVSDGSIVGEENVYFEEYVEFTEPSSEEGFLIGRLTRQAFDSFERQKGYVDWHNMSDDFTILDDNKFKALRPAPDEAN